MVESVSETDVLSRPEDNPKERTPPLSDFEHAKILMARTLRTDRKKPHLWFARFVFVGVLLMLYTLGSFLAYESDDDSSTIAGDYRIYVGQDWDYPNKMRLAGFDEDFVTQVGDIITSQRELIDVNYTSLTNVTELVIDCASNIASSPSDEVCVFLSSVDSYSIYFGGKETSTPFQESLAAAQWAVNAALLNVTNATEIYPVIKIQPVPQLVNDGTIEPSMVSVMIPAIMQVLSAVIMVMFLIGPISYEKLNDVTRSFLLVGVKMRTYMLQWLLYYSINGIVTAGILTLISVFYRLFP